MGRGDDDDEEEEVFWGVSKAEEGRGRGTEGQRERGSESKRARWLRSIAASRWGNRALSVGRSAVDMPRLACSLIVDHRTV